MSFGSTISITVNTVAKVLNRINQDSYGSEYLLRESLQEFRLKIRHSTEKATNGSVQLDRHNIELTQKVFATATAAEIVRQSYTIIRVPYNDDLTEAGYLVDGFVNYVDSATVQSDLLTWQN
jgi:hypothetical protein